MEHIQLVQIGIGGVGRALIEQVLAGNERWASRDRFTFSYLGLADSQGLHLGSPIFDPATIDHMLAAKRNGQALSSNPVAQSAWLEALPPTPTIIIDLSGADSTTPFLHAALERGHRVVLANKKPLAASADDWMRLTHSRRTRYEATVGAGLPVITTIESMIDTGDTVHEIAGCFSGTLGYVFSELERGTAFSAAVSTAKAAGWTEPDPRDDLSGTDVARKALILARTIGYSLDLADVSVEPLYSAEHAKLSLTDFMQALPELDAPLRDRVATAQAAGETLRYVATVNRTGATVGIRSVPQASVLGSLQGPDNLLSVTTTRYPDQPLVVRGPGAGTDRTAAAVLNDLLILARQR